MDALPVRTTCRKVCHDDGMPLHSGCRSFSWIGSAPIAFATGAVVGAVVMTAEAWVFAWPLRLPALAPESEIVRAARAYQALDSFVPESRLVWLACSASSWIVPSVQAMLVAGPLRPVAPARSLEPLTAAGYNSQFARRPPGEQSTAG